MEVFFYDQGLLDSLSSKPIEIYASGVPRQHVLMNDPLSGRVTIKGMPLTARVYSSFEQAKRALEIMLNHRLLLAAARLDAVKAIERPSFTHQQVEQVLS